MDAAPAPPANLFTIPPGAPFLDTLAASLLDGRLIAGFDPAGPFALADVTLYLPTRRAARAIRESFLRHVGRPTLLPRILTLGDPDEDADPTGEAMADLPPAIGETERRLVLTGLVLSWAGAMARELADLPDEELVIPASPADAARLAAALARLIDQVGVDPDAWRGLFAELPADLAQYWNITLEFLRIATEFWPAHLAERGLLDPGARRDALIRGEAARLSAQGSAGPVIAAGSTGSVPATAVLLAAIARLPNGAVVLPGLDQTLDAASWDAVGPSDSEPAGAGHPQYGLKKLLESLGFGREHVRALGDIGNGAKARARLISEAMRPAGTTELWSRAPAQSAHDKQRAAAGIGIVEAASEREEALAIAVILRETIERRGVEPVVTAALVTPDRGLARRVAVELRRWGIDVDDSAGRPLTVTPPGVLARLVAAAALHGAAAETVLALAKHPLAAFGQAPHLTRRAARALERAVLRGPRLRPGFATLRDEVARVRAGRAAGEQASRASRGLSGKDWDAAENLAARLSEALAPLERLAGLAVANLSALVAAHLAAVEAAIEGGMAPADEASEALAEAFADLAGAAAQGPDIAPADYPALFAALMEGATVRRRGGTDPRISIWGALEARLQSVDTIVLAGVNEGTWPSRTRLDPLLSRPMRAALALEPPERRIGLAAHDFAQGCGHANVWLTRAERQDHEPQVASRWLQRLTAYAGDDLAKAMTARGAAVLDIARALDRPADPPRPSPRPNPAPPLHLRPKTLYATRIETLIRDPYAVYARYVLNLIALEGIAELADARERGDLLHGILARFVGERPAGPFDAAAERRLMEIGREAFARYADVPEIGSLWWPRFERIARWFVAEEAARTDIRDRKLEETGAWAVTPDFELRARADRIDLLSDGSLGIVDYKTGRPPSASEVLSLAPQLPLEALIARAGGFPGIAAGEVTRLDYYHISGRGDGGERVSRGIREARGDRPAMTLPSALELTEARLRELVDLFARLDTGYLSRKIPRKGGDYSGDYDHLARVAEWSIAEDTGEDIFAPAPPR